MKGKNLSKYVICFAIVFALVGTFFVSIPDIPKASAESGASLNNKNDMFTPILRKPEWVDQDNNGIADTLDQEVTDRLANGTAQEYVNVTVMLNSEPTAYDANAFASSGGYVTTTPWTYAIYGFGGQIPYKQIVLFTKQNPNVLLVEKEAVCSANLAYAAQQVGARTYVWNTLELQGDPLSSIAIIDSGIDDSHPDFSPGFGTGDFSKKIVAWNDQITPGTTSPYDDNGHGSHVSGLAAGNGFFSEDDSGYATATWGANLGRIWTSGTYLITGMMVNRTGPITVKVKWTSTNKGGGAGKLSALPLYYGDKTLSTAAWTKVAEVSTPTRDTWYTLTYDVPSTPSGGYDMYHPLLTLTAGPGDLYVVFTMSWPYTPPADGFSAWTGIAPQAKLVGVKALNYAGSGTSTGLINGIDWIIANRMAYNITVASMSLGFTSEVTTVNTAVVNLLDSGVTTIATAGNDGSGANYIYTPGSVDEAITVAAMNQFDNIASYSSQGGTRYQTMKPDITAPGGSFFAVPLFSADSNDQDADNRWSDTLLDDAAPMQGTSMSGPVVAGAANIIIQAMGGSSNWNWIRAQALLPKMILLMTATETYPNLREPASTAAPTLERGGKDVHEGYGRMNLDVAVDSILKTYEVGTTVTDALGKPPTLSDISVLGQKLAWARNVQLVAGFNYTFTLTVPEGADYDLYLYNSTGTTFGEPTIVVKSTTAADGGTEEFTAKAPYSGTYYIVVKRATATTGNGEFILESTSVGFDLDLRVMDWDLTDSVEGAHVYVNSDVKTSDADGWANWTGVSGTADVKVEWYGAWVNGTFSVEMNSDKTIDVQGNLFEIVVTSIEEVQGAILRYVNVTVYNATSTASNMIRTGVTGPDGKVSLANVPNSTLTFTCYDGASPQHVIANVTRTITTEDQAETITCDQNYVSTGQAWGIIAKYNISPLILGLSSVFNPKIIQVIRCLKERTKRIRSKQNKEKGGKENT